MTELNLAQAINSALDLALANDESVVLFGEDIGVTGGVFRVTDGLHERYGSDRVIDAPVAESGIVGAALGMAISGIRPVAEIQFLGFAYPAYDQIVSHIGRIRNRSNHRFSAPLVIRIPFGGGIGAAEHHSESSEAIFAHTPGIKVVVPSTPYDAKGMLLAAIADPDPVIFLEPIRLYRAVKQQVPDDDYVVPLGAATTVREGSDVSLFSYGAMVREARRTAEALSGEGISVEVIDLRSLAPLDEDAIIAAARRTGRVVVATESPRTAGMASEVAAVVQERALYSLLAPVERVTGWDTVVPLKRTEHHHVPGPDRIAAAVRRVMEA